MQQVLNARERNNAFLKFLLFFLVTVALIVVAVYFDFRVPREQNERLTEASNAQSRINNQQEKFVAKMETVGHLLDTLDKPGVDFQSVATRIRSEVTAMENIPSSDNVLYNKLNKTVEEKFLDLLKAKEKVAAKEKALAEEKDRYEKLQQLYNNVTSSPAALQGTGPQ